MRRNLTGMMSFHLGRLGSQHTPAEKKIEGSMRLPRNRPGFYHLEKLQCPASSSVSFLETMWEGGSPSLPSFARSPSGNWILGWNVTFHCFELNKLTLWSPLFELLSRPEKRPSGL
jgi:hypothetical protein